LFFTIAPPTLPPQKSLDMSLGLALTDIGLCANLANVMSAITLKVNGSTHALDVDPTNPSAVRAER